MVRREMDGCEDWCITGHSRGGVIASFAAMLLKRSFPEMNVSLVTFGVPRFGDRVAVAHLARLLPSARHYRLSYDPIVTRPGWSPLWPYADPKGIIGLPRPDAPQALIDWKSIPIIRRHDLARYRNQLALEHAACS
jgi:hypothetical protein